MKLTMVPRRHTRGTPQGTRSWARIIGATGAALALVAATFALTTPAQGLDNGNTGPLDAQGFPEHYTDDSGMSL